MKTWAVVDVNNLASRMFYALPAELFNGHRVEAVVGTGDELVNVANKIGVPLERFVYCFDSSDRTPRLAVLPSYKQNRGHDGFLAGTAKERKFFGPQIQTIREQLLPLMGYSRAAIHYHKGFEADDLVASLVKNNAGGEVRIVIIANDSDYHQLLNSKYVRVFNHRTDQMYTEKWFRKTYGVFPDNWPLVKSLMGDSTDDIPGIPGVGEKTALKFVKDRDGMPGHTALKIHEHAEQTARNMRLIKLPFEGTPVLKLPECPTMVRPNAAKRVFGAALRHGEGKLRGDKKN